MATLSPHDRELLAIAVYDQLNSAEMADTLGIREGDVKLRLCVHSSA